MEKNEILKNLVLGMLKEYSQEGKIKKTSFKSMDFKDEDENSFLTFKKEFFINKITKEKTEYYSVNSGKFYLYFSDETGINIPVLDEKFNKISENLIKDFNLLLKIFPNEIFSKKMNVSIGMETYYPLVIYNPESEGMKIILTRKFQLDSIKDQINEIEWDYCLKDFDHFD